MSYNANFTWTCRGLFTRGTLTAALVAASISVPAILPQAGYAQSDNDTLIVAARNNLRGNYNPLESPSGMNFFMTPVFETFLIMDENRELQPMLATDWEVSEDNTVLTLTLREGVKFHNGKPFNAESAKASLEYGMNAETSAVASELADITSVEAIDEYTLALTLENGGAARMAGVLTLAPGAVIEAEAAQELAFRTQPIGTGPWMVNDASDATSVMYFDAFEDYWDPSVQGVDQIEIRVLSQQAAQNGLLDGSIHFAEVANRDGAIAARDAGLKNVDATPAQMMWVFQLNKEPDSPFSDERLRLALAYAIDRQALFEHVFSQLSLDECRPSSQAFPSASPYYDGTLPGIAYDPEKVQELLDEAGYPDGFEFTAAASSTFAAFGLLLQAMQPQLAEHGLDMTIELQPLTSLAPDWIDGRFDAKFEGVVRPIQYYGPADVGEVNDAVWEETLAAAFSAPDVEAQTEAWQAWSRRFQEIASTVTICSLGQSGWVQPEVQGFAYSGPQWIEFKGVTLED